MRTKTFMLFLFTADGPDSGYDSPPEHNSPHVPRWLTLGGMSLGMYCTGGGGWSPHGWRIAGEVAMVGRLPHRGQPIEWRRLRAFYEPGERLHCLQLDDHFVKQAIWPGSRHVQDHALRLRKINENNSALISNSHLYNLLNQYTFFSCPSGKIWKK